MGVQMESLSGCLSTVYHKFGRHILPIVVLVSYTFLGGLTFMLVERPNDQSRINAVRLFYDDSKSEFLRYIHQVATDRTMTPRAKMADNVAGLQEFQAKLLYLVLLEPDEFPVNHSRVVKANRYSQRQLFERLTEIWQEQKSIEWSTNRAALALDWFVDNIGMTKWTYRRLADSSWNLWGAMFYAGTVYTTIGYGHLAAETVAGRLCTIVYAIIGVPLFLTILSRIGRMMSKLLKRLWELLQDLQWSISAKRNPSDIPVPRKYSSFPVSAAVLLLIFWIFLCGGIFCIWETNWSYLTSTYFFFISLTTIGLGDIFPDHPHLFLCNFFLILFGLALVSMCFNVIQARIEELFGHMVEEFETKYQDYIDADHSDLEKGEKNFSMGDFHTLKNVMMPLQNRFKPRPKPPKRPFDIGDDFHASVGVMGIWGKDSVKKKLLMNLMREQQKKTLTTQIVKTIKRRNVAVQTAPPPTVSVRTETDPIRQPQEEETTSYIDENLLNRLREELLSNRSANDHDYGGSHRSCLLFNPITKDSSLHNNKWLSKAQSATDLTADCYKESTPAALETHSCDSLETCWYSTRSFLSSMTYLTAPCELFDQPNYPPSTTMANGNLNHLSNATVAPIYTVSKRVPIVHFAHHPVIRKLSADLNGSRGWHSLDESGFIDLDCSYIDDTDSSDGLSLEISNLDLMRCG